VHPVAFWLLGMGLLQVGMAIVRLLVGIAPYDPRYMDDTVAATAVGVVSFAAHWAASRGLRSPRARARRTAIVVAGLLIFGWASMTLVTLNASTHAEGEYEAAPGARPFSPGYNTIEASWRGIAWPRVLLNLQNFYLPIKAWPAPQILCAVFVLGLAAWMISSLFTLRPPPVLTPRAQDEAVADLRRRLAAFRAQLAVSSASVWLARLLACHLAVHAILTVVALVGRTHTALGRA
jgi:hypothetical protein